MQPEECKAISRAVGSVYEPEQVRLPVNSQIMFSSAMADACSSEMLNVISNQALPTTPKAFAMRAVKMYCHTTSYCVCQVADKFVYGLERGRYLLPSPDVLQDWFLMDATASWSVRSLPLLVSCVLAPLVPLAMFVYTKLTDRIVRQHRQKRGPENF